MLNSLDKTSLPIYNIRTLTNLTTLLKKFLCPVYVQYAVKGPNAPRTAVMPTTRLYADNTPIFSFPAES